MEDFLKEIEALNHVTAIVGDSGVFSYADLYEAVLEFSSLLRSTLVCDSSVLLVDDYSMGSIAMLFALARYNNVVALAVPAGDAHVESLARAAGCSFVIRGSSTGLPKITTRDVSALPPAIERLLTKRATGFVVFSSGSTGPAKGVVHCLAPFLRQYLNSEPCGVMLAFLLFDHIGGLATVLHALFTRGTLVLPRERSPYEVNRCIERYGVQTLHVSPTLLNLALSSDSFQLGEVQSLRRIYYGSEPAPSALVNRVKEELPLVELRQLYGMSEIGVLPCVSRPEDSSWIKVVDPEYRVRIVDGILQVSSPTNLVGYLAGAPALTEDGYFITGDLAEESDGFFRVKGRDTDLINVGGTKVYPIDVENILKEISGVLDVVVYGQPNPLLGQVVAARFSLSRHETLDSLKSRVFMYVKGVLTPEQVPRVFSISEEPLHTARFKKSRKLNSIPGLVEPG
ncbi:fatty acid--CoA ligase family protein [Paraburkholderia sp. FT54]|uniref:ANL family adenylate-forming protein n=1 Tax=Paraburkholderia sp. FT54 TaxID=3074437 RepID=UPI002877A712|nr:fatty acid--CoA ligase family protein [Paraburkholderia sp. FT54]WNC88092.1 fatty acid--CoA ligase family protein [Paraburkholderia sp. FT54]